MFRRATGMTFREHLNSIRLYKSLQALRSGKDSLEMIAAQYGFSNARAYSTVFARRYGMTPSEYRALCQSPHRGGGDAGPLDEINGFGSIYDMLRPARRRMAMGGSGSRKSASAWMLRRQPCARFATCGRTYSPAAAPRTFCAATSAICSAARSGRSASAICASTASSAMT